jgi:hypothetical protein
MNISCPNNDTSRCDFQARIPTLVIALACALLMSACDAQTGKSGNDESSGGIVNKVMRSIKGPLFNEPALRGKIVDEMTQQPLEGALVYGYYATQKGSLGGGKGLVDVVRSFETQTDATGLFEIPAWNSGKQAIDGDAMSLFPMIMIYKPGYEVTHQNLKTIREWQSATPMNGAKVEIKDSDQLYDWSKYPHVLRPVEKQQQTPFSKGLPIETLRYFALSDSSRGMMNVGECGWEAYSKLLMVQHNEWKDILKSSFPADQLRSDGYSKGQYNHPNPQLRAAQSNRSAVDKMIERRNAPSIEQKCQDPQKVFALKK